MNKLFRYVATVAYASTIFLAPKASSAFTLDNEIDSQEFNFLMRWDFQISLANSNNCLDVQWGGKTIRTPVQIWECNNTGAQRWSVVSLSDDDTTKGWFALSNPQSGLCLDVQYGNFRNDTPLWMWNCNSTDAQKFNLLGTFEKVWARDRIGASGRFNNFCIDPIGIGKSGEAVSLWTCYNARPWLNSSFWHMTSLSPIPPNSSIYSLMSLPGTETTSSIVDAPGVVVTGTSDRSEEGSSAATPEPSTVLSIVLAGAGMLWSKRKALGATR